MINQYSTRESYVSMSFAHVVNGLTISNVLMIMRCSRQREVWGAKLTMSAWVWGVAQLPAPLTSIRPRSERIHNITSAGDIESLPELFQSSSRPSQSSPRACQSSTRASQSSTEPPSAARACQSRFWEGSVLSSAMPACASNQAIWNSPADQADLPDPADQADLPDPAETVAGAAARTPPSTRAWGQDYVS